MRGAVAICVGAVLLLMANAYADSDVSACEKLEHQQPRNLCFSDVYERLDNKLKNDYQRLLSIVGEYDRANEPSKSSYLAEYYTNHKKLLISSQSAWEKYRKEACNFEGIYYENGSMEGEIIARCLIKITQQRDKVINADYNVYQQG